MSRPVTISPARRFVLIGLMLSGFVLLAGRSAQLQLLDGAFLQGQADARHLRVVQVPAHRGMITDRNGEPLAVSTPVQSVWANPQELVAGPDDLAHVAALLGMRGEQLQRLLGQRKDREFVYLRRHLAPEAAQRVMALDIPGIYLQQEYRRYYPAGEVAAHLIGFTNVDDRGQEGLELAYDKWLSGKPGAKRVVKDGRRHIVEDVENIRSAHHGKPLALSIDRRIQYLAYRELKAAVQQHHAHSGSIVVLDAHTGEVLALANQPSYNPNNRRHIKPAQLRNRAMTDVFEPGSTMKPFVIAAALQSGHYVVSTRVDTSPGFLQIGRYTIHDTHDYGILDLSGIIRKSSNVGASKIALSLDPERVWRDYSAAGFGESTGSGFPGEADGYLANYQRWRDVERATVAYGYGLSVTCMQLAEAYSVFANDGYRVPVTLLRRKDGDRPARQKVYSPAIARAVRAMMQGVVSQEGTAPLAAVRGYRVAGKTGTVHKSEAGGYAKHRYVALFAGMAPASDPRLVVVVVVNEPSRDEHYGGEVAAPVFSRVMGDALRLLNIPPDDVGPLLETRRPSGEGPA